VRPFSLAMNNAIVHLCVPILVSECSSTTSRSAIICRSADPYFMLFKSDINMVHLARTLTDLLRSLGHVVEQ